MDSPEALLRTGCPTEAVSTNHFGAEIVSTSEHQTIDLLGDEFIEMTKAGDPITIDEDETVTAGR